MAACRDSHDTLPQLKGQLDDGEREAIALAIERHGWHRRRLVAAGRTRDEILREYPYLEAEDIAQACPTPPGEQRTSKFRCANRESSGRSGAEGSDGRPSAGVGRRRRIAGNVTTATVLPVMSQNSTEQPSSAASGMACRSTIVPMAPVRRPRSVTSRVRITSQYMSKGMSYRLRRVTRSPTPAAAARGRCRRCPDTRPVSRPSIFEALHRLAPFGLLLLLFLPGALTRPLSASVLIFAWSLYVAFRDRRLLA